jgi:hypothetical protein
MSIQQLPAIREQFNANLKMSLQQEGSILHKLVQNELMEHEVEHFTTLGTAEALQRSHVNAGGNAVAFGADNVGYNIADQVQIRQVSLERRQLNAQMIYWNACLDRGDNLNMLIDPKSKYVKLAANAMGRDWDRKIIAAFGRTVPGKKVNAAQNGLDLEFPFLTASNIIHLGATLDIGAAAANGDPIDEVNEPVTSVIMGADPATQSANRIASKLTLKKLMAARQRLKRAYPSQGEKFYFLCTVEQITDLLADTSVTSIDFNTVRALVSGDINAFMGFTFILTDMLPARIGLAAGGLANLTPPYVFRDCYAFAESAVTFGRVKGAFITRIDELPLNHYAHSIYVSDSVGAVRMEDKGVVCIKCATPYVAADHAGLPLLAGNGADANACNGAVRNLFT